MAICREYRIPHRRFLAEWDPDDRAKAVAEHIFEASRCRHCGTRREEWDERTGGHRHAYIAALDRCRGCEEMEKMRASIERDPLVGKGVYVILRPNPALG